jgi:mRNA interferase MazF
LHELYVYRLSTNCIVTEVLIRVPEGGLEVDSVVLLNQIRSIDKQRLIKRLGILGTEAMAQVDRAIQISLGIVKL